MNIDIEFKSTSDSDKIDLAIGNQTVKLIFNKGSDLSKLIIKTIKVVGNGGKYDAPLDCIKCPEVKT